MLNFTLKQLRYIEAAGRNGSIAKAAVELSISQSSITAAVDALESEVGFDLFTRTPAKGIRATPQGRETLQLIRGFIDQSRHFESEVRSLGGHTIGSVRIACYATAAPSFLPPILKSFANEFPGISITMLEGNMKTIIEFLDEGLADVAFTYDETVISPNEFRPLFGAPPYALLSTDDPLSQQSTVSIRQLSEHPMVLLDLPGTRAYFLEMFESHGHKPNIVHSTRSSEIVRTLVSGGFGFSILNICPPEYQQEDSRFRTIPIVDDLRVPVFGIATRANTRQPKIVQSFINHCVKLSEDGTFDHITI